MNQFELTAAAQRAFEFAARWTASDAAGSLGPQALLLGLLEEPECRAALLLAARGIGADDVRRHWPDLQPVEAGPNQPAARHSAEVTEALLAAQLRLADYPRPLELATEHLLLGLAAGQNEVADWFLTLGLDVDQLEAEIHRLAGHERGALSVEPGMGDDDAWATAVDEHSSTGRPQPEQPPTERTAVWRILDAAANRAGEGLRVIEDYARFALDDRFLTAQCKTLRHELTAALEIFPAALRQAARETQGDVGATLTLASEQTRGGASQVVEASFQRVQQALRSLEEYAKTLDPLAAAKLEALRYRCYTLQRAITTAASSRSRLSAARLYVLVDARASVEAFERLIDALISAQVDVIQLRAKQLSDRELVARARLLRARTLGAQTLFIVNDRPDIALLSQADGVHVGQDELTVKDVRSIVGAGVLVGVSTHSLDQARSAVLDGADYIGVGPTFPSRTKQFSDFPGLELLQQVHGEIGLPAFAIGGITAANVGQVRGCGFTRVAVSGSVIDHVDPAAAVAELRRLLDAASG